MNAIYHDSAILFMNMVPYGYTPIWRDSCYFAFLHLYPPDQQHESLQVGLQPIFKYLSTSLVLVLLKWSHSLHCDGVFDTKELQFYIVEGMSSLPLNLRFTSTCNNISAFRDKSPEATPESLKFNHFPSPNKHSCMKPYTVKKAYMWWAWSYAVDDICDWKHIHHSCELCVPPV